MNPELFRAFPLDEEPTAYYLTDPALCCCFTGHRDIPIALHDTVREATLREILTLVQQGVRNFVVGGARGFDTIAGEAVLEARERLPKGTVTLTMALPCYRHDGRWQNGDRERFRALAAAADDLFYVSQRDYFTGCMQKRNRFLVQHSRCCICYLRRPKGGTFQTVQLARKAGLRIIALPIPDGDRV